MDVATALSGPLGQRITWTLLHFLWQGAIVAGLLEIAVCLFAAGSIAVRYRLTLSALMIMAACPIVTFNFVRPEPPAANASQRAAVERPAPLDAPPLCVPRIPGARELSDSPPPSALPENPLVDLVPPSLPPRVSTLARWQPYLLVAWATGAGLFGIRLIIGGGMAWRMRGGRRQTDQAWTDRASRLANRMGLRRLRVFISTRVRQSLVTGLWRPMVLLPAAWLAEMPPDMLEGVLAHELAHLRRLDLWAIHLQRLVETLLFYHPAVWWLSRRLDREREMCCDEMAVAAIGDRLLFTKALQWAVQDPAAGAGPVFGAAWKGSRKMIVERIRRLLGAENQSERFFWWPLGLAALLAPALLMLSAVLAKDATPAKTDATPTLAEIAKANDAAWAAIRSVDMEYETMQALVIEGKKVRELRSPHQHWSKEGDRERMHGRSTYFSSFDANKLMRSEFDASLFGESGPTYTDAYADGKNEWSFDRYDGKQTIYGYGGQQTIYAKISPQSPRTDLACQWLRYVRIGGSPMTLSELFASGGVTIEGKQKSKDGDTLWLLEVAEPESYREDGTGARKKNPPTTCTRIYVNADKGFLISRVAHNVYKSDPGHKAIRAFEEYRFDEVTKFQECGRGVYFPAAVVTASPVCSVDPNCATQCRMLTTSCATRLSVNAPLPDDAFAFRFPDQAVVYQCDANGKRGKVSIWGPDNKPVREFATEKEYDAFADRERLERTRKEIEKKTGSKDPDDLKQLASYSFETKDYDKALPAFQALLAADPKSEMAFEAHYGCGVIDLLRGRDFARAAAEFTECLHCFAAENTAGKGKDNALMYLRELHFLRGLAYANQTDGLDRALADLTTGIDCKAPPDPGVPAARLVRSAIYLRRKEFDKARSDIAEVLHSDFKLADAYGISSLIFAKQGDHAKVEQDRLTFASQSTVTQKASAASDSAVDAELFAMLHRTLLRLVPELEDIATVNVSPESKVPAEQLQPALGDMSLILGRVGDDNVLARDLFEGIDDMIASSRVPSEKRDERRAALVKEVADAIRDYAAHVAAGDSDPAKGMSESHRLRLYNMVRQSLDIKMLYQDFRKKVPKEGQVEIQARVDRYFDDNQVKALMKRENVTTPAELETALRAKGTSLECERKSFTEQFIAQQWIVQKVKPEGGPEIAHDEKKQREFLNVLRDKYRIWTVFDAAMKPSPGPNDHDR